MLDAGKSLCSLLKMVFVAFPLVAATTPHDVKLLYQKVDELIQKHINAITAPQASNEDSTASSISFVLLVIKTLAEVQKNIIDPNILVRILQRLARDMGSSAGSHLRQVCPYFLVCFQWRGQIYNPPPPLSLLCFDLFLVEHNLSFLVLQGLLIYMTTDWTVVESFLLCILSTYIRFLFDVSPTLPMPIPILVLFQNVGFLSTWCLHASVPAIFFFHIACSPLCSYGHYCSFFFVPVCFKCNLNNVNFNLCTSLWVVQSISDTLHYPKYLIKSISDFFLRVKRWSR